MICFNCSKNVEEVEIFGYRVTEDNEIFELKCFNCDAFFEGRRRRRRPMEGLGWPIPRISYYWSDEIMRKYEQSVSICARS